MTTPNSSEKMSFSDQWDLEKEILAHRYLYAIMYQPLITDAVYDAMLRKGREVLAPESEVHGKMSSLSLDYATYVKDHAKELLRRGRKTVQDDHHACMLTDFLVDPTYFNPPASSVKNDKGEPQWYVKEVYAYSQRCPMLFRRTAYGGLWQRHPLGLQAIPQS